MSLPRNEEGERRFPLPRGVSEANVNESLRNEDSSERSLRSLPPPPGKARPGRSPAWNRRRTPADFENVEK